MLCCTPKSRNETAAHFIETAILARERACTHFGDDLFPGHQSDLQCCEVQHEGLVDPLRRSPTELCRASPYLLFDTLLRYKGCKNTGINLCFRGHDIEPIVRERRWLDLCLTRDVNKAGRGSCRLIISWGIRGTRGQQTTEFRFNYNKLCRISYRHNLRSLARGHRKMPDHAVSVGEPLSLLVATRTSEKARSKSAFGIPSRPRGEKEPGIRGSVRTEPVKGNAEKPPLVVEFRRRHHRRPAPHSGPIISQPVQSSPNSVVGNINDQAQPTAKPRSGLAVGWSDWLGCSGNILVSCDQLPYHRNELGRHLHDGLLGVE